MASIETNIILFRKYERPNHSKGHRIQPYPNNRYELIKAIPKVKDNHKSYDVQDHLHCITSASRATQFPIWSLQRNHNMILQLLHTLAHVPLNRKTILHNLELPNTKTVWNPKTITITQMKWILNRMMILIQ